MTRPRNFDDILSRLTGAKKGGDNWIAPCPLPGHKTPGGHLTLKDAGDKALVTCQGGRHSYQDICQLLEFDSLNYSNNNGQEKKEQQLLTTTFSADKLGVKAYKLAAKRKIKDVYDYRDETGLLLFQVVRFEPKDFRQRRPDGKGGWIWNLQGVRRVLYRLPELLAAPLDSVIYFPEGEKDVMALQSLGLVATCNPGGAGKFTVDMREPLKDRHVVIIADKDEPGRLHAQQVAQILFGCAASIKILEVPDEKD